MMRKLLFALLFISGSIVVTSCLKKKNKQGCSYTNSTLIAPAAETVALQDSLYAHGITNFNTDAAGFFYIVNNYGDAASVPTICSNVTVTYAGSFFNGKIFDSTKAGDEATIPLGSLIIGWQKGLPYISKGGDITLYLPPSLAYGASPVADNAGNVVIPGNSYLVFKIHLADVQSIQ